MSSATTCW
uniref:ORF1 protein n=1 Tax=Rattus sp. TaxID=10118 RepID=O35835_9MURI|nr:ORF1 [Rattus sp.]